MVLAGGGAGSMGTLRKNLCPVKTRLGPSTSTVLAGTPLRALTEANMFLSICRPSPPADGGMAPRRDLGGCWISARGRGCVIARLSVPLFGANLAGAEVNRDFAS